MRSSSSRLLVTLLVLVLGGGVAAPVAAAPEGTMTWAVHITLASRWLDPAETEGIITPFMVLYALHDALVKPMPAGHQYAEPRGVVDAVEGRAHLRVRPPQGREVPQRRAGHGRRREVLLRALQGRGGEAPQGAGSRGPGGGSGPRALRPQGAVAGLHDVLRNLRHRLRLGRAQGLRREGRRGRLQAGADRRRPLQVRQLQPRHRAGDGGVRGVLAQGPQRQAAGPAEHARRDDARRRPQEGRGGHRLPLDRPRGRGRPAHARDSSWSRPRSRRAPSGSTSPTSGIRSRPGTTGACARPRATPSTGRRSTRPRRSASRSPRAR